MTDLDLFLISIFILVAHISIKTTLRIVKNNEETSNDK